MNLPNCERAGALLRTGLSIVAGRAGKTAISGIGVHSPNHIELRVSSLAQHRHAQVDGLRRWLGGNITGREVQLKPGEPGTMYKGEPVVLNNGTKVSISTANIFSNQLGAPPPVLTAANAGPFISWLEGIPPSLPLLHVNLPLIEGGSPTIEALCTDLNVLRDVQTFLGGAIGTPHDNLPWRTTYALAVPGTIAPTTLHLDKNIAG